MYLYNLIFPKPIHYLPNGLTIYRCSLASHDSSINATIGGPHTSFKMLAEQTGGAAPLMAHFLAGLEKFKKWAPPSIGHIPSTVDENHIAKMMNNAEGDSIFQELEREELAEEYIAELIEAEDVEPAGGEGDAGGGPNPVLTRKISVEQSGKKKVSVDRAQVRKPDASDC